MTSFSRRSFTIGTSLLIPNLLSSCVTPHPLDIEIDRICSSDNSWTNAYDGTCTILQRNILANLTYTLINYAGYFLGSIYGNPVKSKSGTFVTTLQLPEAENAALAEYQESILPSVETGRTEVVSSHTHRDVMLTSASVSDTKEFIKKRRAIEKSGTEAEKSRFLNGESLIERTAQENLKSIQITSSGYKKTSKIIPEFNTERFQIESTKLSLVEEEYHAVFDILKRG